MSTHLKNLKWRYATKKFDTSKKIPAEHLKLLKEAIQLSPSSYGLQPYKVLIIEDTEIRKKLRAASWDQPQIEEASHLLVLANRTDFDNSLVDSYIDNVAQTRDIDKSQLEGYSEMMKANIVTKEQSEKAHWSARQAYIIIGNLVTAAADLKIDACPMEGFDPEAYNQILGLTELHLNAAVVVTLGYRSTDDQTQHYKKVRRPESELFQTI